MNVSLKEKPEKIAKPSVGRKAKIKGTSETSAAELVAQAAQSATSLSEVADRIKREHDVDVTIPTVTSYLRQAWGEDYDKKKKDMSERRSMRRRYNQEFELARQAVADVFKKEYLSTDDGLYFNFDTQELGPLPRIEERAYRKKNIINYSEAADFGWSMDKDDPDADGSVDSSVFGIVLRKVSKRIDGLIEERKKRFIDEEVNKILASADLSQLELDEIPKFMRETSRKVKREQADKLKEFDDEKDVIMSKILLQLYEGDNRTRFMHDGDVIHKGLDPAYASSDKKWRGRQRMLALEDRTFSRVIHNLPFPEYMHPKRLQVHGHNIAKKLPELVNPEKPIVKAEFDDISGVNGRIRFPKNTQEYVETQEAGMIVTEDFAKKFDYFTVVEEGTVISEMSGGLPPAPRVDKALRTFKDYEDMKSKIKSVYQVDRLDPLTLGGFEQIGYNVGHKFAKHSGELVLVGAPKQKRRKITLSQGEVEDEIVELEYLAQDYQIVRRDHLKVGDKILDRGGLKGIVSAVVPTLGKDEEKRPYDIVANYDEVWREEDRKTSDGRMKDDILFKQGKKKSAIVLEHEAGDGQIFFFMIDKFAQDSTTTGLSFSPTLVSGLWERALETLPDNATIEERDALVDTFASRYFRGEGNLVPTLKALHYKAIKKDGVVTIVVDENEPTPDEFGDIVFLPHTYAGNTYQNAYVPHYIARVYFDGTTFREIFIEQKDATPNDASDFYWFNVMKQAKNRFGLFPKMDWGIQLVTRPWAEDKKDPTKYHYVEMNYMDVIDMGGDPYDPKLQVTFRKEPVTSGHSVQTHPVKVDFTDETRGCYDKETQILTEDGWKYFKDLDGSEKVATLNPTNDKLEYHFPKQVVGYQHTGKMYSLQSLRLDLVVTPDHRMWVSSGNKDFKIETAEEMFGKRRRFISSGLWDGIERETITFPSVVREHRFSSRNQYTDFDVERDVVFSEKTFQMDDWVEFLGYYISEGYGRRNSEIIIGQSDKDKQAKIVSCIKRLGYEPRIDADCRIVFSDIVIAIYLEELGKSTEKYIPREFMSLSRRQLKILFDALMLGDGHLGKHNAYYTSSARLADDFQELCLKIGLSASIYSRPSRDSYIDGRLITSDNLQYAVNIRMKYQGSIVNSSGFKGTETWVDYDDMVYCVEVPNGLVYVKRNGKPVWCGNTIGLNPTVGLKATIDYDGDTIVAFVPVIEGAVSNLDKGELDDLKLLKKRKFDERFEDLYGKAKKVKYAESESELGVKCARYNQETAETENELIERLGGLRKRSMILQGKEEPPVVTIGTGTKDEESHVLDMETINRVTDVEKILKMREPRWLLKDLQKKPWDSLTDEQKDIVRDYHVRKELKKVVDEAVKDPGVRKLYDLLREPSQYMKEEFMSKAGDSDPIGMKLDTNNRLLDRILYNEIRMADIFTDLDAE